MLTEISLQQVLMRIVAMIVLMGFHGATLAGAAWLLGDRGPKYDGRLTLNPFAHFSVAGLVSGIASRGGFLRYMAIDPAQMKLGRWGLVLSSVSSIVLLVVLAQVIVMLRVPVSRLFDPGMAAYVAMLMTTIAECAIWFAILNLIPLPPLTGGHFLAAAAPRAERFLARHSVWIGVGLAVLMLLTRGLWLQPLAGPIRSAVF